MYFKVTVHSHGGNQQITEIGQGKEKEPTPSSLCLKAEPWGRAPRPVKRIRLSVGNTSSAYSIS